MPQVDLESLVCGGAGAGAGDRKVSCETVIAGGDSGDASPPRRLPPPPAPDHDFPPESITIRIGDDAAFSELNPIYERDDSTKGSTNPKSSSAAGGACNPVPLKARSNSARIAGGPAAATATFFGLPARIRPAFTRRQPSQGRILPDKRSGGTGEEPRSPKVSCIGKVLSDRERCGRRRQRRWWRGVAAVFRCGGGCASRGFGGAAGKKMALDLHRLLNYRNIETHVPLDVIITSSKQIPVPLETQLSNKLSSVNDAPEEERDSKMPSSPDLADQRFTSGVKAVGRGEEHRSKSILSKNHGGLHAFSSLVLTKVGMRMSLGDASIYCCPNRLTISRNQSVGATPCVAIRPPVLGVLWTNRASPSATFKLSTSTEHEVAHRHHRVA